MTNFQVYQQKLIINMRKQFSEWLSIEGKVSNNDIRRFFHSISGTAPTIGLDKFGDLASKALTQVDQMEQDYWTTEQLQELISPLLKACYRHEYNVDIEATSYQPPSSGEIVFLINQDTSFLMILKDYLESKGLHVFAFKNRNRAISALYDMKPDCLVFNHGEEVDDGFITFDHFSQVTNKQYFPIVVISDDTSSDARIESYKNGADDYILKSVDLEELYVRIHRQIERKHFVDHLILIDELTKLYNRKYLEQVFKSLISRQWEDEQQFSIAFIDLDNFKQVNDQFGHIVGDNVLKSFADFVSEKLQSSETFIRYGGEEFVIIFPNNDANSSKKMLENILNDYVKKQFQSDTGHTFFSSFSAGVVAVDSTESTSLSFWLDLADMALYESKNQGKQRITVYQHVNQIIEKPISVAIVEDDIIMQVLISNLFKQVASQNKMKIAIQRFSSGEQFIDSQWHKNNTHGIVMLNVLLEGMTGLNVIEEVDLKSFTVLMISADKAEDEIRQAIELDISDYVKKPFSLSVLESKISFYLRQVKP